MTDVRGEIINTTRRIAELADSLILRHEIESYYPIMYIDLEGVNPSHEGSISIFTLLMDKGSPIQDIYLLDVHSLGARAFNTAGEKKKTLKDILQDDKISKVFFDVRNISDALLTHFGVTLQGVDEIQLIESASRRTTESRKFLHGLAECVETHATSWIQDTEIAEWKAAREKVERLFKAEHGGSFDILNRRPILKEIIWYCVSDVKYLPRLRSALWNVRNTDWQLMVSEETKKRIAASQTDSTLAPWTEEQNRILDVWNELPLPNFFDDAFHENDASEQYNYPDDNGS